MSAGSYDNCIYIYGVSDNGGGATLYVQVLGEHAVTGVSMSFDTSWPGRGWESVRRVRLNAFPLPRVIPASPTWTGLSTHSSSCRIPRLTNLLHVAWLPSLAWVHTSWSSTDSKWGLLQKPTTCPRFSAQFLLCSAEDSCTNPCLALRYWGLGP